MCGISYFVYSDFFLLVLYYIYLRTCFFFIFFFKQKTAYEMRISDWSSDVCSSDLIAAVMAIYHFSAKVISRANGSSAVASAAYRAAERLHDDRLGRDHDFSNKAGVVLSEILAPEGAPERLNDRATLWNEVEAGEKRKDAQLAREVEFSIPRELNQQQGIQLARDFVEKQFVERGMVADMNVHWDMGKDGRSEEHTSELQSLMRISYAVFCLKKKNNYNTATIIGT